MATATAARAARSPSMPLYGYMRVSHMGKRKADDEEFHSVNDQEALVKEWERRHKRKVIMLPPELDGKGDNPNRPILRRAIDGILAGEAAGIVTAYLSRGGRDLRMMLDVWHEVEQVARGEFWAAKEDLSGATRQGRLTRNILMSVAQDELDARREDFANLREWCIQHGVWKQRRVPYGYRKDTTRGSDTYRQLVPYEPEAEALRQAARDFLAGTPVMTLAARLDMTTSGLRQRFRNRVSLGELRDGELVNVSAYTPIVPAELFDQVVAKLDDNPRPSRRDPDAPPALLARRVFCAACGNPMTRKRTTTAMYACEGRDGCTAPASITCARLDGYVEPLALAELEHVSVEAVESNRGIAQAERDAATARANRKRLLKVITEAEEDENDPDIADALRDATTAQREADERLRVERARSPMLPAPGTAAEFWSDLDGHERNALLRGLLKGVVVRRGNREPLDARVRVVVHGSSTALAPFPDADAPGVLRSLAGEDQA